MEDLPDCIVCGACCFSNLERYVRVTGDDHARMGERADELTAFDGNRAYMRMRDGHCEALCVDGLTGRLTCAAYAIRPEVCRALERGSSACLGERHAKAERPLVALRRARSLASAELARVSTPTSAAPPRARLTEVTEAGGPTGGRASGEPGSG